MTEPSAKNIRILVCDNHSVVRTGLRHSLEAQDGLTVVGEAKNGVEAVALVRELKPDVVCMDLRMPEMDGVTATSRIKAERPETQVLVLTTYHSDADINRALGEGAVGYILKDEPNEAIVAAIRAAARGDSSLSPSVASRLVEKMREKPEEALTSREVEVLSLMAKAKGNKEIARELYLSEDTVKTHVKNVYQKLGATDRIGAVLIALKRRIVALDP